MTHDQCVPRETVVQIAQSYRELQVLTQQRAELQAKMIRGCLAAIRQTTVQAARKLEQERAAAQRMGGRHRPVRMHEPAKKVREDRDLAMLHLEWLATCLEDQSGTLDLPPDPSIIVIST